MHAPLWLHLAITPFLLQCYCFLCDAEASQCKEWGTGEAATTLLSCHAVTWETLIPAGAMMLDHCNAHDTSFYVNLKSSLKKKRQAQQLQHRQQLQHPHSVK